MSMAFHSIFPPWCQILSKGGEERGPTSGVVGHRRSPPFDKSPPPKTHGMDFVTQLPPASNS